jgi:protein-disulfide isomerase
MMAEQQRGYRMRLAAIFALLFMMTSASVSARADSEFTPQQKADIESIVHDYFLNHPEAFIEAIKKAQGLLHTAKDSGPKATVSEKSAELYQDPMSPVAGNRNGDVTIVEFFDYRCPYCRKNHVDLVELAREDPNVRIIYKDFPVLGPESVAAARAMLAANAQGGALRLHDALMQSASTPPPEAVFNLSSSVGLDNDRLAHDMTSPEVDGALNRNMALARSLGITATPTFVVGDRVIPGAMGLATLKQLVQIQRAALVTQKGQPRTQNADAAKPAEGERDAGKTN